MKKVWQEYSEKFLSITPREQYLILLTGLVAIIFGFFTLAIDGKLVVIDKLNKQIKQTTSENNSAKTTIAVLEEALKKDPNDPIKQQIAQYEKKLRAVDDELLLLTSDLINPVQMRHALIDLLKAQGNVKLLSFEIVDAQPLAVSQQQKDDDNKNDKTDAQKEVEDSLTLYKHGIKLQLSGRYFELRDYLKQLENLDWQFFWQEFDYQLTEYPKSELTIHMYSLSTKKEFIGV